MRSLHCTDVSDGGHDLRPDQDVADGTAETDGTFIDGEEPGLRGGQARGKYVLTCIAVEVNNPKGFGRCRMAPIVDASAASLHAFVTEHVEPGPTVITDGWQGYRGLDRLGYVHERRSQRATHARGDDPGKLLPAAPRTRPSRGGQLKPRLSSLLGPRDQVRRRTGVRQELTLIAMVELTRGGLCPPLPGRTARPCSRSAA